MANRGTGYSGLIQVVNGHRVLSDNIAMDDVFDAQEWDREVEDPYRAR